VSLLVHGYHSGLGHEGLVLALDLVVDQLFVVILQPISLTLHLLLQLDVSLTVLVNVLEKVGASLVFASPLSLTGVPLLLILVSNEAFDHSLVFFLVVLALLVESLESHNLLTSGESLLLLKVSDGLLSFESSSEHVLITSFFKCKSSGVESTFLFVVSNEVLVALSVELKLLGLHIFLLSSFDLPLVFKHALLFVSQFSLFLTLNLSGVSLPVADSHSIGDKRFLGVGLLNFTVDLLLSIELPELGVDHLFIHLGLELSSLIDELLLTLDLSSVSIELLIFFAELIGGGFKSLVHASLDFGLALSFTLALQVIQTLKHLTTDLLRGLQAVLELHFVLGLLSRQKLGETALSLFEVSLLTSLHVGNPVADHAVFNSFHGLAFPMGLVVKVAGLVDGTQHLRLFKFHFSSGHDVGIRPKFLLSCHFFGSG